MKSTLLQQFPARWGIVMACLFTILASSGCVRRRMTVRSQPAGTTVYVDDQWIGVTPVSSSFTYYGTRKLQLFKDGFETVTVKQPFKAPWYQYPPLDFFFENLWPGEIRDERIVEIQMQPQQMVPNHELLQRAEALRNNTNQGLATPLPNLPPAFQPEGPAVRPLPLPQ